jgi:hypothetical protein
MNMLSLFLHRKRMAAKALAASKGAATSAGEALEQTREVYGTRLLVRGLLWISIYLLSRGLLELTAFAPPVRVAIALLPLPFFVWYLWTWMKGVGEMDELQRRIELEALGFAFPATLVFLMKVGLMDLAIGIDPENFSLHNLWLMLPVLYYIGLWRAQRRYL